MRKRILLLAGVLLGVFAHSQQTYFSNNYDVLQWANYTGGSLQCNDSSYVFISTNIGPGSWSYSFIRVSQIGDTVLSKHYVYNDRSPSLAVYTSSIFETQDGAFFACGSYIDTLNNREGFLVKFDSDGDTLWTCNYTGLGYDQINSVIEDSVGRLILGGTTTTTGNGQGDFWLLKVSSLNGSVIWSHTYGTSANENGFVVIKDLAGGYVMSGQSTNQPYLVRTDTAGNVLWQYNYNFNGYGFVAQNVDTGYFVACSKILSANETDGCLVKLNKNGVYQWHRNLGLPACTDVFYTQPLLLPDGIVCAGVSQPASGYPLGYLVKTDTAGFLLWHRTYVKSPVFHNYIYDVSLTLDFGFLLSGSCILGTSDAWLLKVDSLGCEVAGCDGASLEVAPTEELSTVFPSPAQGTITFRFATSAQREIRIYDSNGRCVQLSNTEQLEHTVSINTLKDGMYYYETYSDEGDVARGRFVVVK
jgi:hypothetical protein